MCAEVAPTPPVEPEPEPELALVAKQPRAKRRKIKYDEAIVLTNEYGILSVYISCKNINIFMVFVRTDEMVFMVNLGSWKNL